MKPECHIRFDVSPFLEAAKILMEADEAERALLVLDNLPGFYRDFAPLEIEDLRNKMRSKIFTVQDYSKNADDHPKTLLAINYFLNTARAQVLIDDLKKAKSPVTLVDYGPGDYCLPLGLKEMKEFSFYYYGIGLEDSARKAAKERMGGHWLEEMPRPDLLSYPSWFLAYEIIEHLHNPWEIRYQMDRLPEPPEKVFLSTPKYCYHKGCPDWERRGQPHLRTYTPAEFTILCQKMFPEYAFEYFDNEVMVVRGTRLKRI